MAGLLPTIRFTFIGHKNTGKTAIGLLLTQDLVLTDYVHTPGVQIYTTIINNSKIEKSPIKLIITDIGSSERLKTVRKYLFDGSDIICYFLNITDEISFKELNEAWSSQISTEKKWLFQLDPRKLLITTKYKTDNSDKYLSLKNKLDCYKQVEIINLDKKTVKDTFVNICKEYYEFKAEKMKVPDDFADIF